MSDAKSLKGTQTEKNLLVSFAGEAQARNRYGLFASKAGKEGYQQIADIFAITAEQERIHAKTFFNFLEGGDVEITAAFPAGVVGTTAENLASAAAGEKHEHSELYPHFAQVAEEEGFPEVAAAYRAVSVAERNHESRYNKFLENLKNGQVFSRDGKVIWYCRKCGYLHVGTEAPKVCPSCKHPQAYFEIKAENY